jgi:heat shock protein HslJ
MDMHTSTFVVALSLIAGGGALATDLQNTKWVINDVGGRGALDDSRATIEFTNDGHAGGHAGCNDWNAAWHGSGAKLSFGPVATTRMACSGPVDDREREFVAALTAVKAFRVEPSGLLILSDKHNKTAIRASQM